MLKKIILTCFRKHRSLELDFAPGLNVFRAPNEQGKSSILQALGYAWLGTRALPEPLADVVTYGEKTSALKVEVHWTTDGVDYQIVRSESGCELRYSDQLVTGQTETRKFVERLFRCSADMFKHLLMADQNSIRGVVADGGSAGPLIEALADLSIIETLIDGIQHQLPSGNTKALEARIAALEDAAAASAPALPDESALDAAKAAAEAAADRAQVDLLAERQAHAAVPAAQAALDEIRAQEIAQDGHHAAVSIKQAQLAKLQSVKAPTFTRADLDAARRLAADEAAQARRRAAYATVFPKSADIWDTTDSEPLPDAVEKVRAEIDGIKRSQAQHRQDIAVKRTLIIKDTTCPTCKREIDDAHKVSCANADLQSEIALLEKDLAIWANELKSQEADLGTMLAILKVSDAVRKLASAEFWDLDESQYPPIPKWKGEVPGPAGQRVDVAAMEREIVAWERTQQQIVDVQQWLADTVNCPTPGDPAPHREILARWEKAKQVSEASKRAAELAKLTVMQEDTAIATAKGAYAAWVREQETRAAQLAEDRKVLAETIKHNEIVKKLRNARPEVNKQLWNTVLAAVSYHFTEIRGVHSTVTRGDDGFLVNSKPIKGLSGSARDMLGLAMRIALSKTFLPHMPMLVLDEPFSGCDNAREMSGLCVLAAAGFDQTLLVTHSELADTMATNLVTF